MSESSLLGGLVSKSSVAGAVDSSFTVVLIILGLAVVGGLGYYIFWLMQFKHKFRVKEVVHGRKIIIDDKARELRSKDGGLFWQLLRTKIRLPVPPAEAIEVDNKGRKCVEAYKLESGDFIYSKDLNEAKDLPVEIKAIKNLDERRNAVEQWIKEQGAIYSREPLTTSQRMILINQIEKAVLKKTKKWQDYLLPIAAMGSFVIIIVSLMIFYGDIAKPVLQMGDKINKNEEIRLEQLKIIQEIERDVQIIKNEVKPGSERAAPS